MAIDRSKFKKTSASQLAQQDKELNKTMGRKERTFSNGHEVEEGSNLFRIYPVHPDIAEKDPTAVFAVPFVQTFLPAMVQEKDKDNKPVLEGGKPKLKLSVRPVFNAKVHGKFKKDLVEEYIQLAIKNAKDMDLSEEDRKEYLKGIYGAYSPDPKKSINGINYPQAWVVYADKYPSANPAATPSFDEWRLKKSVKDRLNKISAVEAANDPLGTDPFTDIEEGKAVKVLKDSEAKPATNIYTTELDSTTFNEVINGKTYKLPKTYPLTDTQLEHFLAQEPLHVKYGKKLATRKNFEAQLTGLELFDAKYEMGIFELSEWSETVQEIDGYYPENGTEASPDEEPVVEVSEVEETTDGDEFDLLDRKELQAFCKENKTGILVRPALSDDDIRNKLREWKKNSVIPHKTLPNEEGHVEEEVETVVVAEKKAETTEDREAFLNDLKGTQSTVDTKSLSAKDRLNLLRNKGKTAA
jgi:hypothetical protein